MPDPTLKIDSTTVLSKSGTTVTIGGTNTTLLYTMGIMMFSMGVGSYLTETRWFKEISFDIIYKSK